jgi:hypothetical protein
MLHAFFYPKDIELVIVLILRIAVYVQSYQKCISAVVPVLLAVFYGILMWLAAYCRKL